MTKNELDQLSKQYHPVTKLDEMWSLMSEVLDPLDFKYMLEIGLDRGGSVIMWTTYCNERNALYLGVDTDLSNSKAMCKEVGVSGDHKLIEGSSMSDGVEQQVKKLLDGNKLDFLYIDGDHGQGAYEDARRYVPFVRSGGIIAWHDVDFGGVKQGIKKTLSEKVLIPSEEGLFWIEPRKTTHGIRWFRKE